MRKIIYYVATSLDGFIEGPNGDISGFLQEGPGVTQYLKDLQAFDTVIMGRNTYEFGYQYGLQPGQPAYPHMQHYVFSNRLQVESPHPQVKVCPLAAALIHQLKSESGSDIYLCGGGQFAGWLLDQGLIDRIKIKLNPLVLGAGTPLFGGSTTTAPLQLIERQSYPDGLQILTYQW
ncbi:MAG: dihydrofolate reductase family protein [Bacteroidota bacterium]